MMMMLAKGKIGFIAFIRNLKFQEISKSYKKSQWMT